MVIDRIVAERIHLWVQGCVRQIKGLAPCSGGEEGRITFGSGLHDLVLDRIQIHSVLAGNYIGSNSDALLLEERMRIPDRLHGGIARQVIGVMDDMCRIVALQHQHQLEVIAEVVLTQAETVRQCLLVNTSGDTTDQAHFGLVVEPYPVDRFDRREGLGTIDRQSAVRLEHMTALDDLQRERLLRQ